MSPRQTWTDTSSAHSPSFSGSLFSNCRIIPLKTKKPQSASYNQYESALNWSSRQDVLHRHPLYLIVRMMCYDDGLGAGKNLLALKTTDANQEECSIWVYQCSSSVSRQWKRFKRGVHHKCEVTYPVNDCCLFFITCVNRSRLNPSARCCRLLLTVFWHQRSPEASEMEGGWEENNCKNQHEAQQGKWLGFFFLRNWNMVLNLQLWLIFNVTRAQNGTSRNPSAQRCQNIATLCRNHMVHSLVHFTYKPLRSPLCIAVFFRDKQYWYTWRYIIQNVYNCGLQPLYGCICFLLGVVDSFWMTFIVSCLKFSSCCKCIGTKSLKCVLRDALNPFDLLKSLKS